MEKMRGEDWTLLVGVPHETEADIICGLLETNEIPTEKKSNHPFGSMKVIFGHEPGVKIYVPAKFLSKAQELIKD